MAGCCGKSTCSCIINAGSGIEVTGSGTATDPYVITSSVNDLSQYLRVEDTTTVNMSLTGTGTDGDPLVLRAVSLLRLTELSDVQDPSGGPSVGEVPVWVGSGEDGHFEFQTPPVAPAGATNVTNGLSGIGSVGDPVKIETSGTWGLGVLAGYGGDSTIGAPIYVDSNGDIRSQPLGAVAWADITGKPATFPPSAHTHTASQITDQNNINAGKVNGIKLSSTPTSVTAPASPTTGDLWFFPKDS